MDEWILIGPMVAGVLALFGWVLKHTANGDRHPKKSDLVVRDVCKVKHDMIESHFNDLKEKLDDIKKDYKAECGEIKQLIRNSNRQQTK